MITVRRLAASVHPLAALTILTAVLVLLPSHIARAADPPSYIATDPGVTEWDGETFDASPGNKPTEEDLIQEMI